MPHKRVIFLSCDFIRNSSVTKTIRYSFYIKVSTHHIRFEILSELYLLAYLQWSIFMNALNRMIINCSHNMCTHKYIPVEERILVSSVLWKIRLLLLVIVQSKIPINTFIEGVLRVFSLKIQLCNSPYFVYIFQIYFN